MLTEKNILSSHNISTHPCPKDNGHQNPKLISCIYMIHFVCSVTPRICIDSYFSQFLCNTVQILKRVHICYAFMLRPVIKSVVHHQIHVYFSQLYKQKFSDIQQQFLCFHNCIFNLKNMLVIFSSCSQVIRRGNTESTQS